MSLRKRFPTRSGFAPELGVGRPDLNTVIPEKETVMPEHSEIIRNALSNGILNTKTTTIGVMDFDRLGQTVSDLKEAFPANFSHTFAVKANSLKRVLSELQTMGLGAEVASPGELELAFSAGFGHKNIIFDSPAKTKDDLETCIANGISLNLDNEQEFARVCRLMPKYPDSRSIIGFRVNPQIGSGQISSTSTATRTSKFGFPVGDAPDKRRLIEYYCAHPFLTSIHTHSGSQGCPLDLMAAGVERIVALAEDINERVGRQQITRLDIGGGLPVNFASDEVKPTFAEYAEALRARVPQLFSGKYQVKTEFGRAIAAKSGFMVSRVEYTKNVGGRHIAITHAGAHLMTRTAFLPQSWPIRVKAYDAAGNLRTGHQVITDVAGPCCFAADLVAREVSLAELQPDDFVAILDTGAYYFSNHFDYNSLPRIAVYATKSTSDGRSWELIRTAEDIATVVSHMSPPSGLEGV